MSSMIGRVAESQAQFDGRTLIAMSRAERSRYIERAKAAIEAMREPNPEVIGAFWRQKNCGTQEIGEVGNDTSDYAAWRAAIDAALKEGER